MNNSQKLLQLIESLDFKSSESKYKALDNDNSRLEFKVTKLDMYIAFYYLIAKYKVNKDILDRVCNIAINDLRLNPVFVSSVIKKIYNIDIFSNLSTSDDVYLFIDIVNKYNDINELEKYFNKCNKINGFNKIYKELLKSSI